MSGTEREEHRYLAAWHLYLLATAAAGADEDALDFRDLTDGQRGEWFALVARCVDLTDHRRWAGPPPPPKDKDPGREIREGGLAS